MNGEYRIGDIVLGNWMLNQLVGEGSYGKVYEASREDFGVTYKAAIKIITIPQNKNEIKSVMSEGMDEKSVTDYFRTMVEEIVREFALMSQLKGTSNVVSYEDHAVLPHENGIGWDILIRMELLTPLLDHLNSMVLSHQDVVGLGIDICRALELCKRFNIVHRDIKPENIFVSELGDYKLGDFGIARTLDRTTSGLSKKGTYAYMAPEVYKENAYGPSVDIYSLGLVLYRLLNDNRAPFLPKYPEPITFEVRETALSRRIDGEPMPAPRQANDRLARIILKACAYNPKERYSDPAEMRKDLETVIDAAEEVSANIITAPVNLAEIAERDPESEINSADLTEGLFHRREPAVLEPDMDATECMVPSGRTSHQKQFGADRLSAAGASRYLLYLLLTIALFPSPNYFAIQISSIFPVTSGWFFFVLRLVFCCTFSLLFLIISWIGKLFSILFRQKEATDAVRSNHNGPALKAICALFAAALLIAYLMEVQLSRYMPHMLGAGIVAFLYAPLLSGYLLLYMVPCLVRQRNRLRKEENECDALQERRICVQTLLSLLLCAGVKTAVFLLGPGRFSCALYILLAILIDAPRNGALQLSVVSAVFALLMLISGATAITLCICNLRHIKTKRNSEQLKSGS